MPEYVLALSRRQRLARAARLTTRAVVTRPASAVGRGLVAVLAAVVTTIGLSELVFVLGLGLLAAGLWQVSQAAGLAVPGLILIWIALPARPAFFERRPDRRGPPARS